ncbi:hypothetical protein ACJZ2D_013982 [Fusarium nematophilum]
MDTLGPSAAAIPNSSSELRSPFYHQVLPLNHVYCFNGGYECFNRICSLLPAARLLRLTRLSSSSVGVRLLVHSSAGFLHSFTPSLASSPRFELLSLSYLWAALLDSIANLPTIVACHSRRIFPDLLPSYSAASLPTISLGHPLLYRFAALVKAVPSSSPPILGPAAPAPRGKADNAAMSAEDPMEYNEPTALGYDLEEFENDERQDQVPETRVLGPSGDGPDGSPTFTVWSVNLKRCDKRRNALKRAVRGTRLCPGRHPDVIAVQDAEAGIVFKPMPGYHFWISPKLKLTEKDGGFQFKKTKRGYRSARKNTANADPAQVVNANPAQDAKDGPEFPHVCFYVDKSIPTTAWRVEEADTEANKGLFATLKLTTASGSLAIHNAVGLELLTKPGTITYSNSLDTSKRSSTLDLTFASGRIRPLMEHCKPLEAAGFMSDHRIIETVMRLDAPREIKIRPRWSRVNRTRFIQTLEPRLPPKDHPLDTHDQMDDYCGMIGRALGETIKDCVPLVRCGYQLTPPTKQESGLDRLRASLTRLETRFRATKDDGLCAEMDRLQQEIKHQEQEHWRCYTEKASKTTKSAYNLAAMGRKFAQPQEPCQVPPLSYDGKIWVDDKDKLSIFEKTLFRENDNPSSKAVPEPPPASARRWQATAINLPGPER